MNPNNHYHPFSKFLHWTMGSIWLGVWILGFLAVHFREQLSPHHILTLWHKAIAITLVFLVVLRVAWRITTPPPALPSSMGPMMQRAAAAGHIAIYVLALLALPMSGWALSSVAGKPVVMLGLIEIPAYLPQNKDMVETVRAVHTWISWLCGAMVLGHILVALKHHVVDKDGVLIGMLPRR
jgi:cytochrome b561